MRRAQCGAARGREDEAREEQQEVRGERDVEEAEELGTHVSSPFAPESAEAGGGVIGVRFREVNMSTAMRPTPDTNRDVGDVEGRPVAVLHVDVDEIDHEAVADAIDQVAERASQHQRQAPF